MIEKASQKCALKLSVQLMSKLFSYITVFTLYLSQKKFKTTIVSILILIYVLECIFLTMKILRSVICNKLKCGKTFFKDCI